ncbi:MAG: hypothetical protein AABX66_01980 [Nanoarchaeota archaeon]
MELGKIICNSTVVLMVVAGSSCSLIRDFKTGAINKELDRVRYHCAYDSSPAISGDKKRFVIGEKVDFNVELCTNCVTSFELKKHKELWLNLYEGERLVSGKKYLTEEKDFEKRVTISADYLTPGSYFGRITLNGRILKEIPLFTISPF